MTALLLDGVSKTRGTGRHAVQALRDVSLTVSPGELVLLEGPSGAGKTTLLAVAAGLLSADAGRVVLGGLALDGAPPAVRRKHRLRTVGFVFQRANLLGELTVRENVLLMAALADVPGEAARREVDTLLEDLGLASLANRRSTDLSGGEEQRVALARALVHRPPLVLADEPTGNLDGASGRVVAEGLAQCACTRGAAVLVATHDSRLESFATRRVHIVDGRLDAAG
ncbi:MAG TPA: ABC transporter ATP-binding protein [Gemmatimonadales bacterium]|nr:ABC transporter ATP-binding protein [Gemmatimonadales bacterium]